MNSKSRRESIAECLRREGEVSITALAVQYGTSEMTIRRDLDLFVADGVARRTRGGAISVQTRSFEPPILKRSAHMADAKKRIGVAAASLLRENESVVLDVGTTTHAMARAIRDDLSITVITSSLLIATELSLRSRVRTLVTGGELRHGEMSLIGSRAEASYHDLNCDTMFLGVAGVSDTKGLTEYNVDDAQVKRAAIACAQRIVVLADASKIGQVALVTVAPMRVVDLLITDASPHDDVIKRIRDEGIDVLHVGHVEKERE